MHAKHREETFRCVLTIDRTTASRHNSEIHNAVNNPINNLCMMSGEGGR